MTVKAVSDSVADLLVERLNTLADQSIATLTFASCIGTEFDMRLLSGIYDRPITALADDLHSAIRAGILHPSSRNYRIIALADEGANQTMDVVYAFQHDRIHQAVYTAIPKDLRIATHSANVRPS